MATTIRIISLKLLIIGTILFSFAVLDAQIYYKDFIPDKILEQTAYDSIDVNLDGVYDLKFTQEDSVLTSQGRANGVGVTLLHYDIEFLGLAPSYDPSHFYTYKLDSNILVDQNAANHLWVSKLGPNDVVRIMQLFFYNVPIHLGEWVNNVVDGYLGIRIKINNDWHYGWIRMDVDSNANKLVIKDYAYNEVPFLGIYTQQKTSFQVKNLEITYVDSLCSNLLAFQRGMNSRLAYDKVYKMNATGIFDSIGSVLPSAPSYFIDFDTANVLGTAKYIVSSVDTSNIEWQPSDMASSIYAEIMDSNNQNILKWSPYVNQSFNKYYIYAHDSLSSKVYLIDSVNSNVNSYPLTYQTSSYHYIEYKIGVALQTPIIINPNIYLDTIFSNIASENNYLQIQPEAGFYHQIILDSTFDTYQFYDTSKANIDSYFWDFGDGTTSIEKNPVHNFSPGLYSVNHYVENCFGMDSIVKHQLIHVINGIQSSDWVSEIRIFPNPTYGKIYIEGLDFEQILLLDSLGNILNSFSENNIDLGPYSKGVYFIKIIKKNSAYTRRVVVL